MGRERRVLEDAVGAQGVDDDPVKSHFNTINCLVAVDNTRSCSNITRIKLVNAALAIIHLHPEHAQLGTQMIIQQSTFDTPLIVSYILGIER